MAITSNIYNNTRALPITNIYTMSALGLICLAFGFITTHSVGDKSGFYELYILSLIQITPFVVAYTRRHFDYLSFILLNHLVSMSLGKFNKAINLTGEQAFPLETVNAIREQILCTLIIIAVYYICRYLLFFRFVEKERYQLITLKPLPFIILTGYVFLFPVLSMYLPAAWLATHFISVNADLVLLLTSHCPQMPRLTLYSKLASLLACFIYLLKFGSLGMMLNFLGLMFISGCLRRNVVQIAVVSLVLSLGLLVQSVKSDFRNVIFSNRTLPLIDRAAVLGELLANEYSMDGAMGGGKDEMAPPAEDELAANPEETGGLGKTLLKSFDRVNDESLERVLAMTPSQVPYWNGETYASIPYMFIPRPLWPEKPSRHFWNKYGREYGYLLSDDNVTSVAVSFLAEGYMNFGYLGLYGVAVLFGFLVAAVERLGYYIAGGYFFFSFTVFLMPLLHYSSDLGSMLHALVIFFVVMWLVRPQIHKVAQKDEYS